MRSGDLLIDDAVYLGRGARAVALHVELEVQPEAAGVPIGAADQAPGAVDGYQLAVIERRARIVDGDARRRQKSEMGMHGPLEHDVIGAARHDNIDLDAPQRCDDETGRQSLIGKEIRRYDAQAPLRLADRGRQDGG